MAGKHTTPIKNNLLITLAIIVVPAVFLLCIIVHDSVNVPYFDDYHMVPVFQQIDHHEIPARTLFELDNENREVFPKLVMGAGAYITHWNIRAQILINFGVVIAMLGLLYVLVRSTVQNKALQLLAIFLSSFWLLSPTGAENWLWAWQAVWYICIAAVLLAIYLAYKLRGNDEGALAKYLFGASVAAGIVATFSLASGLLVWPIVFIMFLLQKQKRKYGLAWAAAGLLTSAVYFYHYVKPARSPSPSDFLHEPVGFAKFFLTLIGRPISDNIHAAMTFGGILLLLLVPVAYLLWLKRENTAKALPWLAILAFSLAAMLLTAVGRVGGGLENSLSSRYTILAIFYIIGLAGCSATLLSSFKLSYRFVKGLVLVIVAVSLPALVSSYANGLQAFGLRHVQMLQVKSCTSQANPTDACLRSANFNLNTSLSSSQLQYLKSKHWAGY